MSAPLLKGPIFGAILDIQNFENQIEYFVDRCLVWLTKNGLDQQGLFRVSGIPAQINELKLAINKDPLNISFNNQTVHNVASLLKVFFRDLQEPVMTFDLYNEWISCADMRRQENIEECLQKLPEINRTLLFKICSFLYEVQKNQSKNKMNSRNLATCIGPCLLRPLIDTPEIALKDSGPIVDLFTVLIDDYEYIFLDNSKNLNGKDKAHILQRPNWKTLKPNRSVFIKIFTEGHQTGVEKNFSSNITDENNKYIYSTVKATDDPGVYEVCYIPSSSGLQTIEVMFNYKNIMGSPLTINIPTMIDFQSLLSLVTKLDIRPVYIHSQTLGVVFQPFRFTTGRVAGKDGETLQFLPAQYQVEVIGPDIILDGRVTKILGTGGLEVEFSPEKEGLYQVQVYIKDTAILQKPLVVKIRSKREGKIESEKEKLNTLLESIKNEKYNFDTDDTLVEENLEIEKVSKNIQDKFFLELDEIEQEIMGIEKDLQMHNKEIIQTVSKILGSPNHKKELNPGTMEKENLSAEKEILSSPTKLFVEEKEANIIETFNKYESPSRSTIKPLKLPILPSINANNDNSAVKKHKQLLRGLKLIKDEGNIFLPEEIPAPSVFYSPRSNTNLIETKEITKDVTKDINNEKDHNSSEKASITKMQEKGHIKPKKTLKISKAEDQKHKILVREYSTSDSTQSDKGPKEIHKKRKKKISSSQKKETESPKLNIKKSDKNKSNDRHRDEKSNSPSKKSKRYEKSKADRKRSYSAHSFTQHREKVHMPQVSVTHPVESKNGKTRKKDHIRSHSVVSEEKKNIKSNKIRKRKAESAHYTSANMQKILEKESKLYLDEINQKKPPKKNIESLISPNFKSKTIHEDSNENKVLLNRTLEYKEFLNNLIHQIPPQKFSFKHRIEFIDHFVHVSKAFLDLSKGELQSISAKPEFPKKTYDIHYRMIMLLKANANLFSGSPIEDLVHEAIQLLINNGTQIMGQLFELHNQDKDEDELSPMYINYKNNTIEIITKLQLCLKNPENKPAN